MYCLMNTSLQKSTTQNILLNEIKTGSIECCVYELGTDSMLVLDD